MQPMYPDTAQAYRCPFNLSDRNHYNDDHGEPGFYCIAGDCLAWEEVPRLDGQGICSRLSRRRVVQPLSSRPLEIILVDILGDCDESEVQ